MTNTILLVEDDDNDVFFMQHAMKKAGIGNPIRVATNGQQAIDYFKCAMQPGSNGEFPLPTLVLLDLKLPFVMGLDVLKWIREQPELAPIVVILSASSEEADVAMAYHRGANAYLVKPSDARQLDVMVKAIKAFWLTENTPPSQPNLEKVVVGLARKCLQEVPACPDGVTREDLVESCLTNPPRTQEMQQPLRGFIPARVEQRIIDALKTSPPPRFCQPPLRQIV